ANQASLSWSRDSRWLAYDRNDADSRTSSIWIYDLEEDQPHQVTSGFFNDNNPVFSRKGDWLYYSSNRNFSNPDYEDVGASFIYDDTGRLIAVPLNAEVEDPWEIEADEETWEDEDEKDEDEKDKEEGDEQGEDDEEGEGDEADEADADEDADADDEEADEPSSPIHGVWAGTAKGFAQIPGMEED